jgi:RNA polymerase sigma-70 factor, ECF subfamily
VWFGHSDNSEDPFSLEQPTYRWNAVIVIENIFANDGFLANTVVAGSHEARERLVKRLMPRVRAVARRILLSEVDTDDAAQNAMLAILKSLHTYKHQTSLERWADRIAARVAIHFARNRRRRERVEEPTSELPSSPSAQPAVTVPLELEQIMRTLPEAPREALQLKYILGLSVDEIAEMTDVPVNTAKTRLKTGLRLMREALAFDGEVLR